jgi:hypothetical protein
MDKALFACLGSRHPMDEPGSFTGDPTAVEYRPNPPRVRALSQHEKRFGAHQGFESSAEIHGMRVLRKRLRVIAGTLRPKDEFASRRARGPKAGSAQSNLSTHSPPQRNRDLLSYLALECNNVRERLLNRRAVSIGVGLGIDELHNNPKSIAIPLDAALDDGGDTET